MEIGIGVADVDGVVEGEVDGEAVTSERMEEDDAVDNGDTL